MGDPGDEKAKRVKNLLSMYYAQDSQPGAGGGGGERKVTAIDSAAFDAEAFVSNLVKTSRLDALQGKYTSMTSEIRHLDSDMQMLVYENYSKFITATDTIRRMKANVEEMEGRMEELQSTVLATSSASEAVNNKLARHRSQIEDLNNIRGLLKKLQSVFDLPSRVKTALQLGALSSAVREYAAAAPLLERYGTGAFAAVAAETAGSIKQIAEQLRAKLRDPETRPEDAAEALELLQLLRMPQDELQGEWLSERRKALQTAMAGVEKAWAAAVESGGGADVREFVSTLNRAYLGELMKTAKQYKDLFPESRRALVDLSRTSLAEYMALLKRVLSPDEGKLPSAKSLMSALAQLAADLSGVSRVLPEARLDDRAAEVVERTVRHHVIGLFQRLEERVAASLAGALADLPQAGAAAEAVNYAPLLRVQVVTCNDLIEGLSEVLREISALQEERPVLLASWKDIFAALVQGQAQTWFTGLTATIISAAGLPPMPEAARMMEALQASPTPPAASDPTPAPAVFLLFLLRMTRFLEARAVEAVMEKLAAFFHTGGAEGEGDEPTFNSGAVMRLLRTAQSRLLVGYVQQQGRKLSKLVRKSMASPNWLDMKEPRDVRPVCDFILAELKVVESEVAQLMETERHSGAPRTPGPGAPGGGQPPADRTKAISRNVAKLFQEKLKIFDEVEQTSQAVLLGVLKIALKSWVECVRLVTLGRAGYQQLQLDVHYMRPPLRAFAAANADIVDSLLDEASSAAADRAVELQPLEQGTLDYILQNRQQRGH